MSRGGASVASPTSDSLTGRRDAGELAGAGTDGTTDSIQGWGSAVPVAEDLPELVFVRPLPGFAHLERYVLVQLDDRSPDAPGRPPGHAPGDPDPDDTLDGGDPAVGVLYELRSTEQPEVSFLVAVPTAFFSDYAFELDQTACAELGLTGADEALVLVILTIGADPASTTANLLAPVVINARTRSAVQTILSGTDWPVRAALC